MTKLTLIQAVAIVELVAIAGLVAGLDTETQTPSAQVSHSNDASQTSDTSQTSSTQSSSTSSTTQTLASQVGVSTQSLQQGPLGNSSSYYPNGAVFLSRNDTIPIFLAQPNSSAVIYIVYKLNDSEPLSLKTDVNRTADEPAGSFIRNSTSQIPYVFPQLSPDVSVVPSPNSVSPGGGIVSFSFTISGNASGLYAVYLPHLQCTPLWLAARYTPSQITASSFPFPASICLWGAPLPGPPVNSPVLAGQ